MPVSNRITIDGTELPDRFVSRDVAAEFCGVSAKTLASWAWAGVGPKFSKLSGGRSGATRYSLAELRRFMADPVGYSPRPIARFNKPEQLKKGGNPAVVIGKARARRGKGARGH